MSLSVTTEFRLEYEQERASWLRRRVLWYTGVITGLTVLGIIIAIAANHLSDSGNLQHLLNISLSVLLGGFYLLAFLAVWRALMTRERLLRLVYILIVASGTISVVGTPVIFEITRDDFRAQLERARSDADLERVRDDVNAHQGTVSSDAIGDGEPAPQQSEPPITDDTVDRAIANIVVFGNSFGNIFMLHFVACLFLPWSSRESIKPVVPLLILNAFITVYYVRLMPIAGMVAILSSPLVALPGMLICWWRSSRFKHKFGYRMMSGRYGELKQELTAARTIHDTLFPKPMLDGSVRFSYEYQPMRQIGGDYLYARRTESCAEGMDALNLVLIDVTGHGITAALTVNRLVGEIDREFGEHPDISPGDLLRGLNDYLHHSLARHSVYATALCIRIDPHADELQWASAGHPPAFFRSVNGRIDRLNSTTFLLGVCRGNDFVPGQQSMTFREGDALLAYTDGATEAVNRQGRMLRIDGLQRIVWDSASVGVVDHGSEWCRKVIEGIDRYRGGPTQDDLLMVQVWRPLG